MKKTLNLLWLASLVLLAQCKLLNIGNSSTEDHHPVAVIAKEGLINGFEKGLMASGQPVWCEASAILYDGSKLFFANDKDMPDKRSSVFYWPFKNGFADTTQPVTYLTSPLLKKGKKFEDFALSPDGKIVFLATGFDRVKTDSKDWNAYNSIYYWLTGDEKNPRILSIYNIDSTSVDLRNNISKLLMTPDFPKGMPYFKIEGIAATNNLLYFGVREEGKKFDDFKYRTKILTVSYGLYNGIVEMDKNFKILSDINIAALEPSLKEQMGISSIEYDRFNKRFLILTSFETTNTRGAYLWTASQTDLANNRMNLVRNPKGEPIFFDHKAEDIAIINKNKIIIINDDDRAMTSVEGRIRQPNQAPFYIIEFK